MAEIYTSKPLSSSQGKVLGKENFYQGYISVSVKLQNTVGIQDVALLLSRACPSLYNINGNCHIQKIKSNRTLVTSYSGFISLE